ncbi:MAG: galactokinase [Proteocatella sp.]
MNILELKNAIVSTKFDDNFNKLYSSNSSNINKQKKRYINLLDTYLDTFGNHDNIHLLSAPGRTELGGNHTDHQHGCILAAAVNLDMIAVCSPNNSSFIKISSDGFAFEELDISDTEVNPSEFGTSKSLIRGICAKIKALGFNIGGFDACITSDVLTGSGLSSSAAFEILIGIILNSLFCDSKISNIQLAKIGQFAENVYFDKPCGLMDQMTSAVGGIVFIDFKDAENPIVEKINFDFLSTNHALCIIDTGGSHADLTDEYAAIPFEMKAIANFFDKNVLREISKNEFFSNIAKLRGICGDRAVLRTLHFFEDNKRASSQKNSLLENNWDRFLKLSRESGHSSFEYLQNVYTPSDVKIQPVSISLAICQHYLGKKGSFRVHGGGFAGTIQAFVPIDMLTDFKVHIESVLGANKCHVLSIRSYGGVDFLNL